MTSCYSSSIIYHASSFTFSLCCQQTRLLLFLFKMTIVIYFHFCTFAHAFPFSPDFFSNFCSTYPKPTDFSRLTSAMKPCLSTLILKLCCKSFYLLDTAFAIHSEIIHTVIFQLFKTLYVASLFELTFRISLWHTYAYKHTHTHTLNWVRYSPNLFLKLSRAYII